MNIESALSDFKRYDDWLNGKVPSSEYEHDIEKHREVRKTIIKFIEENIENHGMADK